MGRERNLRRMSLGGLIVLALVAVGLSAAAVLSTRPVEAVPAAAEPAALASVTASKPEASPSTSAAAASPSPSSSPSASSSQSAAATSPSVVVIGDSFSVGDTDESWIGKAADSLGWGKVTNLSSPGRGYIKHPRSCDLTLCSNFEGTVPLISESEPDIVITFGGTADRGNILSGPANRYYAALRKALPDATLVAVSPITGDSQAEDRFAQQSEAIKDAVEAVDGHFVDLGQPALGEGTTLTDATEQVIADKVAEALQAA